MRDGSCPKCASTEIRFAVNGFLTYRVPGIRLAKGAVATAQIDTEDYVCLGCGHFERFLRPGKSLNWIAEHWAPVPGRPPRTGVQDAIPPGAEH